MTEDKNSVSKMLLWLSVRTLLNACLLFVLVEGFVLSYHFSYQLFADLPCEPASDKVYNITVQEGITPKELAYALEGNGIVESDELFLARVYIGKYAARIQAGTYSLGPGMSPDEICKTICGISGGEAS